MKIVLASTSPYRAALLKKTGLPFSTAKPTIEEDAIKIEILKTNKSAKDLALALSIEKGESIWSPAPDKNILVISGDQVAECEGQIIGKPGNFDSAVKQMQFLQNRTHRLFTALSLFGSNGNENHVSVTELKMRALNDREIQHYLQLDTPFDCAGSYKIEENGIALFSSIVSDDFTAIQGIPMQWLCNKLKEYNCEFFQT